MMFSPELPAIVLALLTWFSTPPASIAEASRREAFRRAVIGQSTRALTNETLPDRPVGAETPPSTPPPDTGDPPSSAAEPPKTGTGEPPPVAAEPGRQDEQWWRARITTALQAVERNRVLADALQSRINALQTDFVNRDDPAQRAQIAIERQRALDELARMQKEIELGDKEIAKIREEARRLGVPPGWIR
jgi:hypothetical protein